MGGLVLFLVLGAALAGSGVPLALRKVKPNMLYGFRTRATLEDPDLWYEANAYAGRLLIVSGLLSMPITWLAYHLWGGNVDHFAGAAGGGLLGLVVLTLVLCALRLKALQQE